MYTKKDALQEINETQDLYVGELVEMILNGESSFSGLREIPFTSPTGTGKTVMLAKLINLLPNYFFVVTTLSRGQLKRQIEKNLGELVHLDNYLVYGLNDYTKNTKLQEDDIEASINWDKKVIWIRDEGHVATNRWAEILQNKATWIVNFSATNKMDGGIQCNFTHTMMLRTVTQNEGTPEDALRKLLEVKAMHTMVSGYNPCALFRLVNDSSLPNVIETCEKFGLRYINITDESFGMYDLCQDDNPYDVIINKFKITEGIDLRRCHVIYMDAKPKNEITTIQVIGRARRNALFWRDDIDILAPDMDELLDDTRQCYVYYKVADAEVAINESGEFAYSLCDTISVEALRPGITIDVINGQLPNGLHILELSGKSGSFVIKYDQEYGCNYVDVPEFYDTEISERNPYIIDLSNDRLSLKRIYVKPNILDFFKYKNLYADWDYDTTKYDFFVLRSLANELGMFIDFDQWADRLQINLKSVRINQALRSEFLWSSEIYALKRKIKEMNYKPSAEVEELAMEFAKRAPSIRPSETRGIFQQSFRDMNTRSARFCNDFINYIDRIEYLNWEKLCISNSISKALSYTDNIRQISPLEFVITDHPHSQYLISHGMVSFEQFKLYVEGADEGPIFKKKLVYWQHMLETVHSFKELDEYNARIIDLYEANHLLNIGLTARDIERYLSEETTLTATCDDDLSALDFVKYDDEGERMVFSASKIRISRRWFVNNYVPYKKTINDRGIAIIGPDSMKYVSGKFIEDTSVTSKIARYTKFRRYIVSRYQEILNQVNKELFGGYNDFGFDKKCNSCLGFCVEYFSKIKLYGDEVYSSYINDAMIEAKASEINDVIRVRAAMLIYKEEMTLCYGSGVVNYIPTIKVETLVKASYAAFVGKVIELGLKTKEFVLNKLYGGINPDLAKLYDPNLSVNHISALCDFITEDTILDLKCTSSITQQHILQVLSYHYLSTKRTDLSINRLIVYEAVTGRFIEIHIDPSSKGITN